MSAAEPLQLSTQDERNLLLKEWSCNWKSPSYPSLIKGKYIFKIENIGSNSITGKFDNTFCPAIRDFKGNINKDSFGFEIKSQTNPCVTTKITAKLFREKNGELLLKGRFVHYVFQGAAYHEKGSIICR